MLRKQGRDLQIWVTSLISVAEFVSLSNVMLGMKKKKTLLQASPMGSHGALYAYYKSIIKS